MTIYTKFKEYIWLINTIHTLAPYCVNCFANGGISSKTQLLSRGEWLQVLEHQSLADEIVEWHRKAIE